MTPVAKTGLHCGWHQHALALAAGEHVTPVAKTGLHCGASSANATSIQRVSA